MYRKVDKVGVLLRQSRRLFKIEELAKLWQIKNKNTLYTTIKRYVKRGILFRVRQGLYATRPVDKLIRSGSEELDLKKLSQARKLIKDRPYLVWYLKDYDQLSAESILEAVFNYGDWPQVQQLIKLWGKDQVGWQYRKLSQRVRVNLKPRTVNFFNHYFNF